MQLRGPEHFTITYDERKFVSRCSRGTKKLSGALASGCPKLYVFSRDRVPIYVGATIRPMSERLRNGWRADGKRGFYGYEFRRKGTEVDLDVWVDADEVAPRPEGQRSGSDIEVVEAEVVYLLRHRLGQWPSFQTEIHFYQSSPYHRQEAEKVVGHFGI